MGTATTPSILRGLVVPDPRFRWDADNVSVTSQQGPLPGVPEPQDETEMVLEATGSQASTSNLRVKTTRAGHPGDGAAFVWRYSTDSADEYRGWDPPVSLTGFEIVDLTTTANRWNTPHALALADGTICVAATKSQQYVVVWVRDVDDGTWSEVEVYDSGAAYSTSEPNPCLVQLPGGRLLCIFWKEYTGSYQLRTYYSDDSGATWAPGQKGALSTAIDTSAYVPGRLRAAYLNGQICLIGAMAEQSGPEDQIRQWASNDLGATFVEVSNLTGSDRGYPDIVEHEGTLVVAYVSSTASSGSTYPPYCRVIGSAFEALSGAEFQVAQADADTMEWATQSGGVFDSGELALWSDEDGRLWIVGRDHATSENEVMTRTSAGGGYVWVAPGGGPAAGDGVATWRGRDADTYPRSLSVCAHRGRAMMAHNYAANPGTNDPSLAVAWLGGYTSVCLPQKSASSPSPLTVGGFTITWLPYDFPDDIGNTIPVWAATSTGTRTLASTAMHLVTTAGQSELYSSSSIAGTLEEGLIVLAEVRIDGGTGYVELRLSDATPIAYIVEIRVTATEIQLWDSYGASEIAAVSTTDADGEYVQIFAHMFIGSSPSAPSVKCWYRPVTASGDRKWTFVGSSSTVTSSATSLNNRVLFGQGASSDTFWKLVCYSSDEYTERGLYNQDNWSDLLGRSYMPTPVWVDGGTSIQAVDGPTFRNEDWDLDPRYEYAISNAFPDVAATPRRAWRSVDDSAAVDIDIDIGTDITHLMGALLAVHFEDANFGTAELYGQTAGGGYTLIGTLDRRAQSSLHWGRSDRIIRPQNTGGNAVPYYLPTNILAGSYLAFSNGGEGQRVRRIETNSPGIWNPSLSSLQTRILLEEVDGTEGALGTAAELWSKDSSHVVPNATRYKQLRIRIPQQDTAEGYFRIGSLQIGHLYPTGGFLQEPGWGHAREWASNWEQTEGRTGVRDVKNLGPTRRAVEVAWVDGVNALGVQTEADPSWILGWSGGAAVAVAADVPWSIPGLIEHVQGAVHPVTYLSGFPIPATSSTVVDITDRTVQLYGRIVTESLRVDNVVGDSETGEILRLGVVRIEEEK